MFTQIILQNSPFITIFLISCLEEFLKLINKNVIIWQFKEREIVIFVSLRTIVLKE